MNDRFHSWSLHTVVQETHDTVTILFDTKGQAFQYQAGQFVNVTQVISDEMVTRSYSLSSSPNDKYPSITVKKVKDGIMSNFLFENARNIEQWEIEGPYGNFLLEEPIGKDLELCFLGGGSGITPLFSMMKTIAGKTKPFHLLYSNRNSNDVIFHSQIRDLVKNGRANIFHALTGDVGADAFGEELYKGRLNKLIVKKLLKQKFKNPFQVRYYIGNGQPIIILHGGGPDRRSIIPFAELLEDKYQVIFPDVRGYGQSVCFDRTQNTWEQYAKDVVSLMDTLYLSKVVLAGMGLGSTIAERVAISFPERLSALILISPEEFDKNGEGSSPEEIAMIDQCGEVAESQGLHEAWKPFMEHLAPVISLMVKDAIPRTNPKSFSAAMAIVHSKRLKSLEELSKITMPTLVIPGSDKRHPSDIGNVYKSKLPNVIIGTNIQWDEISSTEELARNIVPQIQNFKGIK